MADTVVRRYSSTAERDADLTFTPDVLKGQMVAVTGPPPVVYLHDGTRWNALPYRLARFIGDNVATSFQVALPAGVESLRIDWLARVTAGPDKGLQLSLNGDKANAYAWTEQRGGAALTLTQSPAGAAPPYVGWLRSDFLSAGVIDLPHIGAPSPLHQLLARQTYNPSPPAPQEFKR